MAGAFVGRNTWQFLLTTLGGSTIGDVTSWVLDPIVSPRISSPSMQTWTVALTGEVLSFGSGALFANGLVRGVAIRNGQVVANDKLWRVKPAAGPTSGSVNL